MLVACASQHGVHGVSHLMEEVLHHAGGEQGGGPLGRVGQTQHQHHDRELVLTRFLALAATTDGEVTVLKTKPKTQEIIFRGETNQKPVKTLWICVCTPDGVYPSDGRSHSRCIPLTPPPHVPQPANTHKHTALKHFDAISPPLLTTNSYSMNNEK